MPCPIRVLLADDHPIMRSGLRHELEPTGDLVVVAEVSLVGDILPAVAQEAPDVAVIGVEFPDGNGIMACRHIRAQSPQTPVLIFTALDEDEYLCQAWAADASGYLVKGTEPEALIAAIRCVGSGQQTYTPEQLERIQRWQDTVQKPLRSLTRREKEVLKLMAERLTNREIARHLGVSLKAVEFHVRGVRQKLHLCDRREVSVWADHIRLLEE